MKKLTAAFLLLAAATAILTACDSVRTSPPPSTNPLTADLQRTTPLPLLSLTEITAELDRIAQINLTLDRSRVDRSSYPRIVGVDARNGRVLVEQYFCWDICPDIGSVLLAYHGIDNELDCRSVGGRAVFAPTPVPGPYGACKAVAAD